MAREPDWESLSQLEFLLMRRIIEPLNAALAAISLVELDSAAERPRAYWQARASTEVLGVLNLVNGWHALMRFKLGELLPHQHIRFFYVQDLLDWLSQQLQLTTTIRAPENLPLEANRETVQEAVLLLYSAAYTLGPNVHLVTESTGNGVWFRVRYGRHGDCPADLDALIEKLGDNWRSQDTAFELRTAADFITLNASKLHLQSSAEFCEMAFFIYAAGRRPPDPLSSKDVTEPPEIRPSVEVLLSTLDGIGMEEEPALAEGDEHETVHFPNVPPQAEPVAEPGGVSQAEPTADPLPASSDADPVDLNTL